MASLTESYAALPSGYGHRGSLRARWPASFAGLCRKLVPRSRRSTVSELLTAVLRYDLSGYSDAKLRQVMDQVRLGGYQEGAEDTLPQVFALVKESIQRRLGAWRFFDPSGILGRANHPLRQLTVYLQLLALE